MTGSFKVVTVELTEVVVPSTVRLPEIIVLPVTLRSFPTFNVSAISTLPEVTSIPPVYVTSDAVTYSLLVTFDVLILAVVILAIGEVI